MTEAERVVQEWQRTRKPVADCLKGDLMDLETLTQLITTALTTAIQVERERAATLLESWPQTTMSCCRHIEPLIERAAAAIRRGWEGEV